ncbi:MAG: bifunctional hydroxymethylpyrimidine kinase/phosphomethylpyrimidine kinase [Deltaproteobacteria bacterium]|nr:bifunctional hydroxymethylpyrimidine kinase/phosphomethylpyrimidine kinase [Deltaproteobacteria bacterium]
MNQQPHSDENPAIPIVLTIAGSDSGGGAGIQADLKTFAALGCYGVSAITAITVQNPGGVSGIQPVDPAIVSGQIEHVGAYYRVGAAKTGMLHSAPIIQAAAESIRRMALEKQQAQPAALVVDPVMVATSGARLLDEAALESLTRQLFPLAALITPNLDEAVVLAGGSPPGLKNERLLEELARGLFDRHGVPVLVKGGHLEEGDTVLDLLFDGTDTFTFAGARITGVNTHGTGCTLSAAIAAHLARGAPLPDAVGQAHAFLRLALQSALEVGRARQLNHLFAPLRVPEER